MDQRRVVKASKYLSRHLRHRPARLGLTLERGGWVAVEELLAACAAHSFPLTREELHEVVARNDKRRFSFDSSGTRIRANQGHSVDVDLGLAATQPPPVLYHGTPQTSLESIMAGGLERRGRHHVHLSPDAETAWVVGTRRGPPVVLEVAAARMAADGHTFHVTENDVWLTTEVPVRYLSPVPHVRQRPPAPGGG